MKLKIGLIAVMVGLLFAVNAIAGEVVQGKCLQYDHAKKYIKIEEFDTNFSKEAKYGKSTGITSEYDLSQAKVGMKIEPNDVLRIAYKMEGNTRMALKVMNVTKQDLRKK